MQPENQNHTEESVENVAATVETAESVASISGTSISSRLILQFQRGRRKQMQNRCRRPPQQEQQPQQPQQAQQAQQSQNQQKDEKNEGKREEKREISPPLKRAHSCIEKSTSSAKVDDEKNITDEADEEDEEKEEKEEEEEEEEEVEEEEGEEKETASESTTSLRKRLRYDGREFCVYLLQSTVATKRTYCGITNRPSHRIRQHNGELVGGAKQTRGGRPWKMYAIVKGFASRSEALRFEWSCHHPRARRLRKPYYGREGRINCVRQLFASEVWREKPLRLYMHSDQNECLARKTQIELADFLT